MSAAEDRPPDGPALAPGPADAWAPDEPVVLTSARQVVLRVLRRADAPLTVDEVAHACELHPNTVRTHLDALVEVGLAGRTRAPAAGRGRPAWLYGALVHPGEEHAALAVALAGQVATLPDATRLAEAAGRAWGRSLPAGARAEALPLEHLRTSLESMGFAPEDEPGTGSLVLRRCPLLDAARRVPTVVCTVHQGLTAALVEAAGGDPEGVEVQPFAEPGGCRVVLAGAPARVRSAER